MLVRASDGRDVLIAGQKSGVIYALDPAARGRLLWQTRVGKGGTNGGVQWGMATDGRNVYARPGCSPAQPGAVTAVPGLVFSGSIDGHIRAFSTADGTLLWDFDAQKTYRTVNEVTAKGGSLDGAGPVVVGGRMFVNSRYPRFGGAAGNVLLAFGID